MDDKELIKEWRNIRKDELVKIAEEMIGLLSVPSAVILSGPVGAGKTTFSKYFARAVSSVNEEVLSPTYSIINESDNFVHADFFRIKDVSEIIHLEISLYIEDKDYFFIEWGLDWSTEIQRELSSDHSSYELEILVNNNDNNLRNFKLYKS